MAYWKVAGFSQPSPIEQILDKEEYTLEELLDEDDIIQECKSLNSRLIAFLKEKKTVEQLLRYLIQPPDDPDDPKKQYRYPFTSCEVFCCEVEAIFNTLLEDEALLGLLFSLLDGPPPLACKAAGYFGRVVGQLLLRKTNEMMQYLSHNEELLARLMGHVDTTSIADIIKRLVGADDHSSMIFSPMHTQWLADTPLIGMLLERLGPGHSAHVQANAADILTAIAHTQPSALASQLMQQASIDALFSQALQPGSKVLVTALDVCAALLEPRRALDPGLAPGPPNGGSSDGLAGGSAASTTSSIAPPLPAAEAITSMLQYLPQLMDHLREPGSSSGSAGASSSTAGEGAEAAAAAAAATSSSSEGAGAPAGAAGEATSSASAAPDSSAAAAADAPGDGAAASTSSSGAPQTAAEAEAVITLAQPTPYGLLVPPLGRARLRVVELLAALLRVGDDAVDAALIKARTLPLVQELFGRYAFNNLLHHQVFALLLAVLRRGSPVMLAHVFGSDCRFVAWLRDLPDTVTPTPLPGSAGKGPLRAGYCGHVTRMGAVLAEAAQQPEIAEALGAAEGWPEFQAAIMPRLELEDVTRWQCGRPTNLDGGGLDSDGDEFANDMDSLEQGMPPGMYHRYGVLDDDMEDDDDEGGGGGGGGADNAASFSGAGAPGDASSAEGGAGLEAASGSGEGDRAAGDAFSTDMLVAGMAGLGVRDAAEGEAGSGAGEGAAALAGDEAEAAEGSSGAGQGQAIGNWSLLAHPGAASSAVDIPGERLMEDDAVLLADDEDMGALSASTLQASPPPVGGPLAGAAAASPPLDDMVLVDDDVMQQASPPVAVQQAAAAAASGSSSAAAGQPAAAPATPPAAEAATTTAAAAAAAATAAPASAADVADADAAATAVVAEQASEGLLKKSPGSKASNSNGGKRQAVSHPVEVPAEELS